VVDLQAALVSLLSADATLVALVSDRIHADQAPQGSTLPYLTYALIASPGHDHQAAAAAIANPTVQIDVWADSSTDRLAVEAAVVGALNGYSGTCGSVSIRRASRVGRRQSYERPQDGSEAGVYRSSLDFEIWHVEDVPSL